MEKAISPESAVRAFFRKISSSSALGQAGWVTGIFVFLQVLRLGSNIVLAHLLAPAIFGVMALINSLRAGVELLTDVGVGQNIVVSKRGDEPGFVNTAWTIQVVRGIALTVIGVIAAWPIAWLYGQPSLFPIFLVCSTIFFLTGIHTPARFLMQRRREVRNLSLLDAVQQTTGLVVTIGFAAAMPSVWGMTWALVVSTALTAAISYTLMDLKPLSLRIDREHLSTILNFGKWIFVSSLVYFAAANFDRLYLPVHIPLALFGVYGISRSMTDLATQFMQRMGGTIVFPAIAREGASLSQRMPRVIKLRSAGLALASVGLGGGIAIGDLFVILAYDDRYAAAAAILPTLLFGAWFSVQATIAEAVLLGLAKPSRAAMANLFKFIFIASAIPLAFAHGNLFLVFVILAAADVPRYFVLLVAQHRSGLRFGFHDLALFLLMVLSAIAFRAPLVYLGLADGFVSAAQWSEIQVLLATVSS